MATPFTNVNINAMNKKQLRAVARNVRVDGRTESITSTTAAQLRTAIKAK